MRNTFFNAVPYPGCEKIDSKLSIAENLWNYCDTLLSCCLVSIISSMSVFKLNRHSQGKPENLGETSLSPLLPQGGYDFRYDYDEFNKNYDFEKTESAMRKAKRKDMGYTWTDKSHWITKLLLYFRIIRFKRVRRTRIRKEKRTRPRQKPRKEYTLSDRLKLRRRQERQHLERLDPNSVQYKILTQDRSKLRRITRTELSKHMIPSSSQVNIDSLRETKNSQGVWMLIHGLVFDISNILEDHPGGVECLLDCVGVDATRVFDDVGHSDIAWEMLENSCVGVIEDLFSGDDGKDEGHDAVDDYGSNRNKHSRDKNNDRRNRGETVGIKRIDDQDYTYETDYENHTSSKEKLIWNKSAIEYIAFVAIALLSFVCLIFLQSKRLDKHQTI